MTILRLSRYSTVIFNEVYCTDFAEFSINFTSLLRINSATWLIFTRTRAPIHSTTKSVWYRVKHHHAVAELQSKKDSRLWKVLIGWKRPLAPLLVLDTFLFCYYKSGQKIGQNHFGHWHCVQKLLRCTHRPNQKGWKCNFVLQLPVGYCNNVVEWMGQNHKEIKNQRRYIFHGSIIHVMIIDYMIIGTNYRSWSNSFFLLKSSTNCTLATVFMFFIRRVHKRKSPWVERLNILLWKKEFFWKVARSTRFFAYVGSIYTEEKGPPNFPKSRRSYQENSQGDPHDAGNQEQSQPKVNDGENLLVDHVHG